jgi:hypothetical protein
MQQPIPMTEAKAKKNGGRMYLQQPAPMTPPIVECTEKDYVCCADELCTCPRGLTATVLCYDCHDDFHQNLCGQIVYLYDHHKKTKVARCLCDKCYNLCSAGRDLCKHPGEANGLVQCSECEKYFHADGCGYKQISVCPSSKWSFQAGYRCKICVSNKLWGRGFFE